MGLWANLPFALAPGMGLNAYFTFGVVGAMGVAWDVALAAVFVEGLIFMVISLPQIGWRTEMINSIPTDLKIATGAGIGMFLALIGLEETGIVVNNGVTLVDLGANAGWVYNSGELIALLGLIAIAGMMAKVPPPEPEAAQAFMGVLYSSDLLYLVKVLVAVVLIALWVANAMAHRAVFLPLLQARPQAD